MAEVLYKVTGTIGQPVFVAILKQPSWKGRKVPSTLLRVPSGKTKIEMPDLILSIAVRMVCRPC